MGLAEIQSVLTRLYVDPALRDRFFADPAVVGAELSLDAEEAGRLACVSRPQVEQFADALRRKRRDQVRRVIPLTVQAMGRRFPEIFERYTRESPPRGAKPDLDDAIVFVETLSRWSCQVEVEPLWAPDLARYELAWRLASRAGRLPIIRAFRFPVDQLARGIKAATPRATVAIWWRPTQRGRVWHLVVPLLRLSRKTTRTEGTTRAETGRRESLLCPVPVEDVSSLKDETDDDTPALTLGRQVPTS
jgi:hypothetical protein